MWCVQLLTEPGIGVRDAVRSGHHHTKPAHRVLESGLTTSHRSVTLFSGGAAPILRCPLTDVLGKWAFVFSARPEQIEK